MAISCVLINVYHSSKIGKRKYKPNPSIIIAKLSNCALKIVCKFGNLHHLFYNNC